MGFVIVALIKTLLLFTANRSKSDGACSISENCKQNFFRTKQSKQSGACRLHGIHLAKFLHHKTSNLQHILFFYHLETMAVASPPPTPENHETKNLSTATESRWKEYQNPCNLLGVKYLSFTCFKTVFFPSSLLPPSLQSMAELNKILHVQGNNMGDAWHAHLILTGASGSFCSC